MDFLNIFRQEKILAVMRNVPLDITVDYAEAAFKGGISLFEVAITDDNSYKQIELLKSHFGNKCIIGAGTAINVDRAKSAVGAGADFLLTPGTPQSVFCYCRDNDIALIPGVLTPTDIAAAIEYGYKTYKLFPASSMPVSYVKDLKTPFKDTNYIAFGGITKDNAKSYLYAGYTGVALCSGLMPEEALEKRDFDSCTEHIKDIVSNIKEPLK